MLISLIIPSFNQAVYLPETIRSILSQNDPAIEVLVIDGGSQDGTVDWLKGLRHPSVRWTSEPDNGQADAINKGIALMKGEVWAYINTDDPLMPGCLSRVREVFADERILWAGGIGEIFDDNGVRGEIRFQNAASDKEWLTPWNRHHPYVVPYSGCNFMRREVIRAIGVFDCSYHYSMDIEYYTRAIFEGGFRPMLIPERMARWRWHGSSKTMTRGISYAFREDEIRIAERFAGYLSSTEREVLEEELRFERKMLVCRKANSLMAEQQWSMSTSLLVSAVWEHPSLLAFRPWWGSLRRVLNRIDARQT